jgi:hypothetical protein
VEFKNKKEVVKVYSRVHSDLQKLLQKYGEDSNEGQIINYLIVVELEEQLKHTLDNFEIN